MVKGITQVWTIKEMEEEETIQRKMSEGYTKDNEKTT